MRTILWSVPLGIVGLAVVFMAGSPAQTGQPSDSPPDNGVAVQGADRCMRRSPNRRTPARSRTR